jgi:hypothetical protein
MSLATEGKVKKGRPLQISPKEETCAGAMPKAEAGSGAGEVGLGLRSQQKKGATQPVG